MPYLSNSLQTNLAILHDEYWYKKWGWRGRGRLLTLRLFNKDTLSCVEKKIKTVVGSLALLLTGDGIHTAPWVEVNRWWWGWLLGWKAWRIWFLIAHYLLCWNAKTWKGPASSKSPGFDRRSRNLKKRNVSAQEDKRTLTQIRSL